MKRLTIVCLASLFAFLTCSMAAAEEYEPKPGSVGEAWLNKKDAEAQKERDKKRQELENETPFPEELEAMNPRKRERVERDLREKEKRIDKEYEDQMKQHRETLGNLNKEKIDQPFRHPRKDGPKDRNYDRNRPPEPDKMNRRSDREPYRY